MNVIGLVAWKLRFLTTIDDWIRLGTMTLVALAIAIAMNLSGLAFTALVAIGVAIDVHDLWVKAIEGKPLL